jgi:hypothetical protein
MLVTVTYFNHRTQQQERRDHTVPDYTTPTIEAVVDLFDAQVGTVLKVEGNGGCLHRSMALPSDLMRMP